MFQLDLTSRKSICDQVVDNIKELIITGVLKKDEKLPSVREMSKLITVNPNTVQKAYRQLEAQGFIYTATGLGTFVSAPKEVQAEPAKLEEITSKLKALILELSFLGFSYSQLKELLLSLLDEGGKVDD